ncbi:MAG TPA: creatininase family protein [bacterium]|nr:creatininase family protein [bacterium]
MIYPRMLPLLLLAVWLPAAGQKVPVLPVQYEELTSPQFVQAVKSSQATCIIPIGIMEKHGPHLPLGTDLIDARKIALTAAAREYAVVFPPYYFGQINEAKHQPGTVAYSHELVWNILQETCEELARNGMKRSFWSTATAATTICCVIFVRCSWRDGMITRYYFLRRPRMRPLQKRSPR